MDTSDTVPVNPYEPCCEVGCGNGGSLVMDILFWMVALPLIPVVALFLLIQRIVDGEGA